jgi:hypothetical protein
MSIRQYDSGPTSNDLLESLISDNIPPAVAYQIVAQGAEDMENIENAHAVGAPETRVHSHSRKE